MNVRKICIIGRGNVGSHLAIAFSNAGCTVNVVNPRNLEGITSDADLYLISVCDDAIADIASSLAESGVLPSNAVIAHTSGGIGMETLQRAFRNQYRVGVLYPMQTFTKGIRMEYASIPFFTEGSDAAAEEVIHAAAALISDDVSHADSTMRSDYHIAAVFACNFTNYLYGKADEYLKSRNLDFKKLLPLIDRTAEKVHDISPEEAQTGPAARGDNTVMLRHLERLAGNQELSSLYTLLSNAIGK